MPIYQNLYQTLLPCPIVELRGYLAACGLRGRLYAYLDYNGPTGTARDNLAEGMLALADERGALKPGQPVIEASSGAFALALTLARQTAAEKGWYDMNWLANDDNPTFHRRVTGPAIVKSIAREGASIVDTVTIGVGSAGTITGVGETIKAWTNDVRIVAVEPYESQALSGGLTGNHGIPEIGFGLVPENYNAYVVDNVAAVTTADAARAAQRVLRTDAIPASISAGAALHAAAQLLANGTSRSALAVFSGRQSL